MIPRLSRYTLLAIPPKQARPVLYLTRMASSKTQQDTWQAPTSQSNAPKLKVINSLTRTKTELVPSKPNHLSWYSCGPTVYDLSHLGHARNYVTQDFIRRILRDYFGHNIHFVMNITDIDDKVSIPLSGLLGADLVA